MCVCVREREREKERKREKERERERERKSVCERERCKNQGKWLRGVSMGDSPQKTVIPLEEIPTTKEMFDTS